MTSVQYGLFGLGEELLVGDLAHGIERTLLPGGAWVDLRRGWIGGSDRLLERLVEVVPWRAESRPMYDRIVEVPRLCCFYDGEATLPDCSLDAMREELRHHYRFEPGGDVATVGMCLYRDRRDSVAWHGDRIGRGDHADVLVAIVSFGATRSLLLRPRGGGRSRRYALDAGDLLVMGGSCQRTWEHCVPKTARPVGPRIDAQFRARYVR